MTIEMGRTGRASAAALFLGDLQAARAGQGMAFGEQLSRALCGEVRVGAEAGDSEATAASRSDGARQILDARSAAGGGSEGPQGASPDPVETLKQALRQAGLDPDAFGFTEVRELVWYPGGTYVNHQVLFEAGAAREYYDVALMLRNPQVTVTEIRRLLAMSAAPAEV